MDNREPVLFSNSILVLFAVIALGALYWTFPGERLLKGLRAKPVDIASLAYVRAASNRDPNNQELRMQLVEKLVEVGNIPEAEQALAPLLKSAKPSAKAQEIDLKIQFRHFFEIKDDAQKLAAQQRLKSSIKVLFPQISEINKLDEFANMAYQMGEPLLAAEIYRHIIEIQTQPQPVKKVENIFKWMGIKTASAETLPAHPVEYYVKKQLEALLAAKAGSEALKWAEVYVQQFAHNEDIVRLAIAIAQAQNDGLRARDWGRILLAAKFAQAGKPADFPCQPVQNDVSLRWSCANKLKAEQKNTLKSAEFVILNNSLSPNTLLNEQLQRELAANQLDNSLQWVQQLLKEQPKSKESLRVAIELAQRKGLPALARQWNAQLLAMTPNDLELIKKQIDYEMAVPDLPKAFSYAQQWLKLAPDDVQAHSKVADFAQWSGQSDLTLKEWLWLRQHTHQSDLLPKIIALATALYQYDALAAIFAQVGQERQLSDEEALTWFTTLQKSSLEDAGSGYLRTYLTRWPKQRAVWLFLVDNLDSLDHTDEAINTLQEMEKLFAATTELRLKRVDFLIKLVRIQEAWQLLRASKTLATANDAAFWKKYAEVAFWVGDERELLTAYANNSHVDEDNAALNFYFLRSLRDKEDDKNYEHYALKIWEQSNDLSILLDLIDAKMQQGQWDYARALLAKVLLQRHHAEKSTHYWLMKAEIAEHFADKENARIALLKALEIDPDSATTRKVLIWHLVGAQDKTQLTTLLAETEALAQTQNSLWEAMAMGYRFLGNNKQALYWYAKAFQQWPTRQPLILEYAQLLQDAGRTKEAKNLWQYLLKQLPVKHMVAMRSSANGPDPALERRYGEILRLYQGVDVSQKWLNWLQRHQDPKDRELMDYQITWYLAQQRFEQANTLATKVTSAGKTLPAWQRLALAANENDVPAIKRILQKPDQLTGLDKVNALRIIGEEQQALDLATQLLKSEQNEEVLETLRRFIVDLKQIYPHGWAVSAKTNNVSELDMESIAADIAYSKKQHGIGINFREQFLSSSKNTLKLQSNQTLEHILNVEWKYRTAHYSTRLKVGTNLRADQDFFTAESAFDYVLTPGWQVHVDAGYNLLGNDSAVFRVAGLTDKIELRLSGEFSKREYFSVYGQGRQYKTRSGDSIGSGYGGGAEIGYRVWFEKPEWVIALYGNWKQADLDQALPEEWRVLVPQGLTMQNILNPTYKELGLDFRFKEGNINPFGFTGNRFRYFVEAGAFWSQPTGNLGAKITGGLGLRLFKDDEISLSGYYSSVQGGAQSIPSSSIELRYSKRFD